MRFEELLWKCVILIKKVYKTTIYIRHYQYTSSYVKNIFTVYVLKFCKREALLYTHILQIKADNNNYRVGTPNSFSLFIYRKCI